LRLRKERILFICRHSGSRIPRRESASSRLGEQSKLPEEREREEREKKKEKIKTIGRKAMRNENIFNMNILIN